MRLVLDSFNLNTAERLLCETALRLAGNLIKASEMLGITKHALKRRAAGRALKEFQQRCGSLAAP